MQLLQQKQAVRGENDLKPLPGECRQHGRQFFEQRRVQVGFGFVPEKGGFGGERAVAEELPESAEFAEALGVEVDGKAFGAAGGDENEAVAFYFDGAAHRLF